ncbi:MAG: SHD1 domain-containing protein, partial [Planctomycetota bacterium]
MKARAILLAAFCLALCAADGPVRTWTDSTGKYTVEAELVGVDNGKVRLKKSDGSVVAVPLVKMSAGDRAFLQQRLQERKDKAPDETPVKPPKTFNPEAFKLSDL